MRDDHLALDLVQDAMLRLAEKYSARPMSELPMLFQRILQNAIRDHFRRQKVRALWTSPLSALMPRGEEDDYDPLDTLVVEGSAPNPADELERTKIFAIIEHAVAGLPARQREAFLLRYWEDMDVAETAAIMGCSQGSVKTHCSRATHALAAVLRRQGIGL